jgi:hypothetical protein
MIKRPPIFSTPKAEIHDFLGAQALCLLNSLNPDTSLDLDEFGGDLLAWYE